MEALHVAPAGRVLLAVDLTTSSQGAVHEAIKLSAAEGAELIVMSVVEPANLHLPGGLIRRVDQERDRLVAGVREIVRRAQDAGVSSTYLIWEGDPAESIVEASISEHADVIVLGCRPRTNIRRILQGSVSTQVTRTASCEVIVVPA